MSNLAPIAPLSALWCSLQQDRTNYQTQECSHREALPKGIIPEIRALNWERGWFKTSVRIMRQIEPASTLLIFALPQACRFFDRL